MKPTPPKETPERLSEVIRRIADGECEANGSQELHALMLALRQQATGQMKLVSGELILKLKFACEPSGVLSVAYDMERKDPKRATSRSVLWVTKGGNLSFDMPRQEKLPFAEVSKPDRRDVDFDDDERKEPHN